MSPSNCTTQAEQPWLAPTEPASQRCLLRPEQVGLDVQVDNMLEVIGAVAGLAQRPRGPSAQYIAARLARREARRTTMLGRGLALPHADLTGLRAPMAVYLRPQQAVAIATPDGQPLCDILALLVPKPAMSVHFELLDRLTRLLLDPALRDALLRCRNAVSVCRLFFCHDHGH